MSNIEIARGKATIITSNIITPKAPIGVWVSLFSSLLFIMVDYA